MESFVWFLALVVALWLLVKGADWLIAGATNIARGAGVAAGITGMTILAFGTSAPELAVGVEGAWSGHSELVVANVVGSNIANVLLIVGVCAIFCALPVRWQMFRRHLHVMALASAGFWFLASDQEIGRLDATILFSAILGYFAYLVLLYQKQDPFVVESLSSDQTAESEQVSYTKEICRVFAGVVVLCVSSHFVVRSASALALALNISEEFIGLTAIAVGTSLPELAVSLSAARLASYANKLSQQLKQSGDLVLAERVAQDCRNGTDMALANVVGSCIFNLLFIVGVSGFVSPLAISWEATWVHTPLMVGAALLLWRMMWTGERRPGGEAHIVTRPEGVVCVTSYGLIVFGLFCLGLAI